MFKIVILTSSLFFPIVIRLKQIHFLPFEFTRMPFIAILAYVVLGEVPDKWVWLGAAVIFGSTLYIAQREHAAHRRAQIQRLTDEQ